LTGPPTLQPQAPESLCFAMPCRALSQCSASDLRYCNSSSPYAPFCRFPARSSRAPARASSWCSLAGTCCSSSSPSPSTTWPSSPPSKYRRPLLCISISVRSHAKKTRFLARTSLNLLAVLQDDPVCMDRLHGWLHRTSASRGEFHFPKLRLCGISSTYACN
jgi:hypothetical protein